MGTAIALALAGLACTSCAEESSANTNRTRLTAKVEKGDLPIEVELTGSFVADDKTEIRMEPKAYRGELIITSLLEEGKAVKKGDVLMRFDPSSLEDALDEARDEVKAKEVEHDKAKAELLGWEIDQKAKTARLAVELEKAKKVLGKAESEASETLADKEKEVTDAKRREADVKIDLDQLLALYEERELHTSTENILIERERRKVNEAALRTGKTTRAFDRWMKFERGLDLPEKRLTVTEKEGEIRKAKVKADAERKEKDAAIAKAKRALDKAKKKVKELETDAGSLQVSAPRDGVVFYGSLAADGPGDVVIVGLGGGNDDLEVGGRVRTFRVLMTIASMDNLSIKMKALESDIQHLQAGLPVVIRPDAFPALAIDGELTKVDKVATRTGFFSTVREFSIGAKYKGTHPQLRSGMNCRVTVLANRIPECLMVPVLAVFTEGGEHYCWLHKDGDIVKRPVKIGASNGTKVQITEGLRAAETVSLYDPTNL